ncbi:hypothetical protein [Modicisalibacter radicis]|uniref:hypothetical protein n=1 Tax=Halomonas sp. EAR18 TaxID=2518972 RepID=UPI001B34C724|nr:hypothetical protein [Halomonas sp. EAR18]
MTPLEWDEPVEQRWGRPSLEGSYERLFHDALEHGELWRPEIVPATYPFGVQAAAEGLKRQRPAIGRAE